MAKALPAEADRYAAPAEVQVQRWTTEDKQIRVVAPKPVRIALRLLNYPAWRVEVNGKVVEPERMDDVNQMVIPLGAGDSEIRARFTRTPDRKAGNAISLVSLVVATVLLRKERKKSP